MPMIGSWPGLATLGDAFTNDRFPLKYSISHKTRSSLVTWFDNTRLNQFLDQPDREEPVNSWGGHTILPWPIRRTIILRLQGMRSKMTRELPQPPHSMPNERSVYEVSSSRNTYLIIWKLGPSLHRLMRPRTAKTRPMHTVRTWVQLLNLGLRLVSTTREPTAAGWSQEFLMASTCLIEQIASAPKKIRLLAD